LDQSAREEVLPDGFWAALWGSALGQRKKLCLRALDQLLDLVEQRGPARAGLLAELEKLYSELPQLLLSGEGPEGSNPAAAYIQGIANLNCMFDSTLTGNQAACDTPDGKRQTGQDTVRSLRVSASSEQAAFLQDLHTVQSAGNMVYGVVHNAMERLRETANATQKYNKHFTGGTKERLVAIRHRLEGAQTWIELEHIATEIAREADGWQSKIRELYYV
jgi:hypothetical protein